MMAWIRVFTGGKERYGGIQDGLITKVKLTALVDGLGVKEEGKGSIRSDCQSLVWESEQLEVP